IEPNGLFEDGNKDGDRVVAQHGAAGDLRYMLGFRDSDREAVAHLYMQHDVNIRTAVANVNNVIRPNLQRSLQLVKHSNLAIASGRADQGIDFAGTLVAEISPVDMIRGDNTFERRLNHLRGRSGQNIKIEVI